MKQAFVDGSLGKVVRLIETNTLSHWKFFALGGGSALRTNQSCSKLSETNFGDGPTAIWRPSFFLNTKAFLNFNTKAFLNLKLIHQQGISQLQTQISPWCKLFQHMVLWEKLFVSLRQTLYDTENFLALGGGGRRFAPTTGPATL